MTESDCLYKRTACLQLVLTLKRGRAFSDTIVAGYGIDIPVMPLSEQGLWYVIHNLNASR